MTTTELLILALATWRIASLLAREDGPWDMFAHLRDFFGVYYDTFSQAQAKGFFGKLIVCVWCNSVWVGATLALLYWFTPYLYNFITLPLALSAGAILLDTLIERG